MKTLVIALFFVSFTTYSQNVIIPKSFNVVEMSSENYNEKDIWLNMADLCYMIKFEQNPVGLKHFYENLSKLLKENNLDINKPFYDNSLLPSYVSGLDDFGHLNTAIQVNDAEIDKTWLVSNGGRIFIKLIKKEYSITTK